MPNIRPVPLSVKDPELFAFLQNLSLQIYTANSIPGEAIVAESITADQIAANQITASHIVAGTITATEIANSTITGGKIANATITSGKISVSTLSSITANIGTLTAGLLNNAASSPTAGIRLDASSTKPGTWTRYLDLAATGANPFLEHPGMTLYADGSAEFAGNVTVTQGGQLMIVDSGGTNALRMRSTSSTAGVIEWFKNANASIEMGATTTGGGIYDPYVDITADTVNLIGSVIITGGLTLTSGSITISSGALSVGTIAGLSTLTSVTTGGAPVGGAVASLSVIVNGSARKIALYN